jgi:hypothetical protein
VKIDCEVEAPRTKRATECNVSGQAAEPALSRRDEHVVDVGVALHDCRGVRFNDVRD